LRNRYAPWFSRRVTYDVVRDEPYTGPLVEIDDFGAPLGTLVHIGAEVYHFAPGVWDACFPRPASPGALPPAEEIDMTTTIDDTKSTEETPAAAAPETRPKDDTKPASKARKAPAPKAFKDRLPCRLTDKQKIDVGDLIVEADDKLSALEDEKKAAADSYKAKIELAEAARRELVQKLRTGSEVREVVCIERFVFERNAVETIRTDTMAKLSERAMTQDERQGKLDLGDTTPEPERKAKPDAAPAAPASTDITVTPDLLASAEKAAAEEAGDAPNGAPKPKRTRKPKEAPAT
jgi:hypothetical protein